MSRSSRSMAPRWGTWLVGSLVPAVLGLQFLALAGMAATVTELFDLTPFYVLIVALRARTWTGVARRWLGAAGVLAVLMSAQWLAWYVRLALSPGDTTVYGFQQQTHSLVDLLMVPYLLQSVLLLGLCLMAAVASLTGMRRARTARATTATEHGLVGEPATAANASALRAESAPPDKVGSSTQQRVGAPQL